MPTSDETLSDIPKSAEYAEQVKHREQALTTPDGRNILIRHVRLDDAEAMDELGSIMAREQFNTFMDADEYGRDIDRSRSVIELRLERDDFLELVAEADGRIVGFVSMTPNRYRRNRHVTTVSLYLYPEWRGQGIGRKLMRAALEWAAAHPAIEKVRLTVSANNRWAIRLYQRFGFAIEGRLTREVRLTDGEYLDNILMFRFL